MRPVALYALALVGCPYPSLAIDAKVHPLETIISSVQPRNIYN